MKEAKKSPWSQFLLIRLLTYAAGSSILMTGLKAYFLWRWRPTYADIHPEWMWDEIAGTACSVFLTVFLLGGAILGTIHFVIALLKYRRVASRDDKKIPELAGVSHASLDEASLLPGPGGPSRRY